MSCRLLACALAAIAVAGFGAAADAETYGSSSAPVQLSMILQPTASPHATSPAIKGFYTERLEAWAKAHPDVAVNVDYNTTDISAGMSRLLEQAAAGRAPDIAVMDSFFVNRFYKFLQPLDPYVSADQMPDFVPFARNGMHDPDGKLKALWVNTDVRALHYRKDLVPVPPKTWDDVIRIAADLSKKGEVGYLYPGGRGEASVMEHLPMFWAQGGELIDASGKPVFGEGANRVAMLKILTFLKRTVDSGASPSRVATYGFEADMYPEIVRGNVAMFLGGSWMPKILHDLGSKAEWSVAQIPLETAGPEITASGGWTYGMFTTDPAKQKLAVDLLNSMVASKDAMAGATTAQGNLPTRVSVAATDGPYFSDPVVKTYLEMLTHGRARPGAAIYPAISTELQVAISSVITGQATPDAALDRAWTNVLAEYKK